MACQRLEAEYKWCLSGTPIINSLKDIYPVFSFIGHPKAGNPDGFRSLIDSDNAIRNGQRVQAVLRTCSMRRTKNDTLMGKPLIQLPKKRERLVELDFTPDERALYSSVEANSKAAINRALRRGSLAHGDFSAFLVLLLRLRQCCSHPWLILNSVAAQYAENELDSILQTTRQSGPIYRAIEAAAQSRADMPTGICQNCNTSTILVPTKCQHMEYCIDCITDVEECQTCRKPIKSDIESILPPLPDFIYSTKCRALADQIIVWRQELPGQKIIVFSLFTQLLDLLQAMIQSEPAFSDSLGFQRYQGSMTLDEREAALHNFRTDPNCTVLLTSMKAGGVGLNLTDGSLVVSMDLWWNRATEDQAFARVHRLGQTKEVEVVRLVVKDTVEQRILALQRDKMRVAGAALGEGDLRLGDNLSMRELLGLFGNVERDAMGRMQVV